MTLDVNSASSGTGIATSGEGENRTTYEINKDFAEEFDNTVERSIDVLRDAGASYDVGSEAYDRIDGVIDDLGDVTIDFHGSNSAGLDANMNRYFNAVENQLGAIQGDALNGGANTDDALALVSSVEALLSQITDAARADPESDETGDGGSGVSTDETYDLADVSDTLSEARDADAPADKASLLGSAIDALIEKLTGGGTGEAPDNGGSGASPTDPDTGGDIAAPPPPPAPPQIETESYSGDALMGKVYAEGGGGITYDDSDGGLGIDGGEDDEIDGGEKLIFEAGETVQGGEVVFEDLHGESGSRGTINVMKDGEVVDTIKVNGDLDGQQAVRIDQEFDSLEFFVEGGSDIPDGDGFAGGLQQAAYLAGSPEADSSFAISSISVDRKVEGTAPAPDSGTPGEVPNGSDPVDMDVDTLVALLQTLSGVSDRILGEDAGMTAEYIPPGLELSDDQRSALLDQLNDVMEPIVAALEGDTVGEPEITRQELSDALSGLRELVGDVQAEAGDDALGGKAETLDLLIGVVETVIAALDGEQQT